MARARRAAAARAGALLLVLPVCGCALFGGAARAPYAVGTDCATAAVVGLHWTPASRGVVHRISRDGAVVGETRAAGFVDTSISASTTYRYVVGALGHAGQIAEAEPLVVVTAPASPHGDAPYCPSGLVDSMTWDFQHASRAADGSDLWSVTWGSDGNVYAFFGDGGGFGGDDHRGRTSFGIAKIAGPPPPADSPEHNLYGGYRSPYASVVNGKARSIVALGADFYAIAGLYRDSDAKFSRPPPISDSPPHVEIAYSMHDAHSWRDASWTFCDDEEHGDFCASSFVNFGPGGRGAPDRYVYILGTSPAADRRLGGPQDAGQTYLARVPRGRVLSPARYEYFSGLDAKSRPLWARDSRHLQPVFRDGYPSKPGCGGVCPMAMTLQEAVYDFGLKRFIGMAQGRYMAQTAFYEAPNPWGPWRTLSYDNIDPADGRGGWAGLGIGAGESLGVHVVNAWTSADGTTLWMTYSSDGVAAAEAQFPPPGTKLDAFHLVEATLTLADRAHR